MAFLNFKIEASREGGTGPFIPVHIDVVEVRSRAGIAGVELTDISEHFNPLPHSVTDFAYRVRLCLADDFASDAPVFDVLAAKGFDRERWIIECRRAVAQWRLRETTVPRSALGADHG